MRLEEYINAFYEGEARDAVVTQVLKSRVIKQAMDTPAGKALLNNAIDRIRDKVVAIIGACTEKSTDEQLVRIQKDAVEVHVIFNLLKDWAEIVLAGEKHEEEMAKK